MQTFPSSGNFKCSTRSSSNVWR